MFVEVKCIYFSFLGTKRGIGCSSGGDNRGVLEVDKFSISSRSMHVARFLFNSVGVENNFVGLVAVELSLAHGVKFSPVCEKESYNKF